MSALAPSPLWKEVEARRVPEDPGGRESYGVVRHLFVYFLLFFLYSQSHAVCVLSPSAEGGGGRFEIAATPSCHTFRPHFETESEASDEANEKMVRNPGDPLTGDGVSLHNFIPRVAFTAPQKTLYSRLQPAFGSSEKAAKVWFTLKTLLTIIMMMMMMVIAIN